MRGGGLERPGWCEGGPREGVRPELPTCGANGRPGEKEFQPIQKGRGHVTSPSCLEMKDLLQNLEESPAKVPVASEKQSGLPNKEAPGMKADGTGLCCNMGEPRAQARTGALLEASQCSGGVAVSGNDSLVSPEPLSPASSKEEEEEEEVPASARQTEEEAFQNPDQEMNAVSNSHPPVQQGTFGPPSNPSLALALDVCPTGTWLEGQTLQGSSFRRTPWGDCMDLCEVQEGGLKTNPSGERVEDLGEATELPMAEALLQAGSPGRELCNNEHKGSDSMDLFSSPVHKGTIGIQKGSTGLSCRKGKGEHFPSEHGRFLSPAEQLTVPKDQDRHSDIGRFSLCDGVQAALEDDLRVSSSEASSIQEDKSSSLRHEKCITLGQGNGALLSKRHNFGSFQNSCSIKYVSTFLSCWAPQLDFGGNGLPLRVDSLRTALLLCDLALPHWATSSFCVAEIGVLADEKSLKVPQLGGPSPFAQKADPSSGRGGPMDSLSPEGVIVMQSTGAWPHHKEAFAPSQASGRLQAQMNEGAWEMVRWVLRGAENGEVAMEAWRKALRLRDQEVNDLPSAPEETYALARNPFLDCRHLQEDRRGAATKIAFSLRISPALLESSGRFISLQKIFSCSPYRNNCVGLGRAGRPLNSVYPLEVSCSSLSKAGAENWSFNGGDAFDGSESILERKGNIFPPYKRVEVHKASYGADAGGMKTGNATGCNNTRLSLQLACDGDLSKTSLLCRATFRKDQCLEEQEKYQNHPSSPASNLSYLNRKDSSLCTKCSARQREPIYQMKIFLYPCYSFDSCTLFEEKNNSPKTEVLECQQPSLIFYKKLNYHDLQTVIRSAIKYVRYNKNESLHSKVELQVTPSATAALLTGYHQGPFHKIITESSNNNTGSEFTGNLLNEDFLESQSPRTLSGSSASESLNQNDFVKNWAPQSKTHNLHSASESIHKRPSGRFNFEKGLLSASKLASSPFQTGPMTSAQIKGQERMKGLLLKSYRKRKIASLLSAGLGSQFPENKKTCVFPKEAAFASPSHGSPLARRHCRASLLCEREAGGRSRLFGLESERASRSPGRDAAAACSLPSRRTCKCCKGPRVEAVVSLYPLEQPLEDLEADLREAADSWDDGRISSSHSF
ncbi:hypothetical protein E2320_012775 [Naja naja]|nr:hypothetical protein E2320_012775 [Naja naja]